PFAVYRSKPRTPTRLSPVLTLSMCSVRLRETATQHQHLRYNFSYVGTSFCVKLFFSNFYSVNAPSPRCLPSHSQLFFYPCGRHMYPFGFHTGIPELRLTHTHPELSQVTYPPPSREDTGRRHQDKTSFITQRY
ncbi:unnamed protein product, partial [Ectocarpus sp. 13 AM-2016]